MKKISFPIFPVLLFSFVLHSEGIVPRPGLLPTLAASTAALTMSSGEASWLGFSALVHKFMDFFQQSTQKAEHIKETAKKRHKSAPSGVNVGKAYLEKIKARNDRISELRQEILKAQNRVGFGTELSWGDLTAELLELLAEQTKPDLATGKPDTMRVASVDSKSEPGIIQPSSTSGFWVPGIWQLAPKKKDKKNTESTPPTQQETADTQVREDASALQASTTNVGITLPGSAQIAIPTITLPLAIFQQLQTENAILRNENAELKQQIQIIYKRDVEKLQNEVARLEGDNNQLHRDINSLREENETLRRENQELKDRLLVVERELCDTQKTLADTQKTLAKLQVSHDSLQQRSDRHQYMLEVGQALGYINDEIRRVFNDPASPGFPGTQRMARRNEFRDDEPRIWNEFVRAHPGAENPVFAGIFMEIMAGRVGLAHPTNVNHMNREEFERRISTLKPDLQRSVVESFVAFVYTFPIPER